jgi:hypothetical protein
MRPRRGAEGPPPREGFHHHVEQALILQLGVDAPEYGIRSRLVATASSSVRKAFLSVLWIPVRLPSFSNRSHDPMRFLSLSSRNVRLTVQ